MQNLGGECMGTGRIQILWKAKEPGVSGVKSKEILKERNNGSLGANKMNTDYRA
jgi:hypothetical protein